MKLPINLTVFASLLFFVVVGIAFVPQAGIEDDEAMIVSGMYIQEGFAQRIKIFGYDTPVMFMSYVGALKSWIYTPIFALWKPSPATLRVPVILISALTIWIFYRWLLRIASRRAALIGCVLLSTDTIFLMTSYFDWGPVVLQHFLSVSGAFFVVRFHQTRQLWFLAAGFFQFGLGMWDKAVFIWILCGMAVAAVVVFPKEVWRCLRPSSLAVATLSFCLGSAPLIFYNVSFPLETFRSTATYSTNQFPEKCRNVAGALSGQALFGYLTRFDPAGHPRRAQSAIEQVSIRLSEIAGHPVSGFLGYALMVALLLTPFLWSTPVRRPFIFSAIAMLVAWLQMLFTRGAGASPHHVVLVWPFPVLLVAIGFAEASRCLGRIGDQLLVVVVLFLAGTSALVTNEYFSSLVRNGGGAVWTDAIYPLSDYLKKSKPHVVYINDWGIFNVVRLLTEGQLPLQVGSDPLNKPSFDESARRILLDRISESRAVFVTHTDQNEMFKGVNAKLQTLATEAGYRREIVAEIADRNGRTIFEVFRLRPQRNGPTPHF